MPRPEREAASAMNVFLRTALTLSIAVTGGLLFRAIGFPAPWLTGPTLVVASAAVLGAPLLLPRPIVLAAPVLLGATMSSTVSPDTLSHLAEWPLSLIGLGASLALVMWACSLYLQRIHGFDPATARFAAVPGSLPLVLALSMESKADVRQVAIAQTFRLASLVVLLPISFTLLGIVPEGGAAGVLLGRAVSVPDLAILLAAGLGAGLLFARLKVPAGYLFGAMCAGVLLYGSGAVKTGMPSWILIPGSLIIATVVGMSFAGVDVALLRRTLAASLGSLAVAVLMTTAIAAPVAALTGLPIAQIWLAFAPGGVETMTIMAFLLGVDPAFVGSHHIARFLALGITIPLWVRAHLHRDVSR